MANMSWNEAIERFWELLTDVTRRPPVLDYGQGFAQWLEKDLTDRQSCFLILLQEPSHNVACLRHFLHQGQTIAKQALRRLSIIGDPW